MHIALKAPLSPFTGYGNDGIGIATSLIDYGADVHLLTGCVVDAPIPAKVAQIFTKEKLDHYDIAIYHLDPDNLFAEQGMENVTGLMVGWTMWEFSNLHNSAGAKTLRKRLEVFDVLVAYDENTKASLGEYFDGPIIVLQGGFMPEDYPYVERDWFDPDHFRFFMLGQLHERKDPWVALQAFNELKHEYPEEFDGAELHLKTNVPGLHSVIEKLYSKVRVYTDLWDKDTVDYFYSQMHCILAPSRGEGKNMPALEFQSTGGIAIATNWGGHTAWLNKDYNYPLDYVLAPLDGHPDTLNARASVEHLKELMLHVYRNRGEAKQKGKLASEIIPALSAWDSVIKRLLQQLSEIQPKVRDLAAEARTESNDNG